MLEIRNLRAGYGAINVLWDVSLDFEEGRLTTIVGPNGAGKSTLLKAIMGLVPATQGEILLRGQSHARLRTWDMADQGVVLVPEGRMVFRDMSVEENLIMGAFPKQKRQAMARNIERAYEPAARRLPLRGRGADGGHGTGHDGRTAHPAD